MDKTKSPRFQPTELEILVDKIFTKRDILFGSFSNTITKTLKDQTWEDITKKINSCNTAGVSRSSKTVKKRWEDLRFVTKKKWNSIKRVRAQTGSSSQAAELSALEEKVVSILGDVVLSGIKGGMDTLENDDTVDELPVSPCDDTSTDPVSTVSSPFVPFDAFATSAPQLQAPIVPSPPTQGTSRGTSAKRPVQSSRKRPHAAMEEQDPHTDTLINIEREQLRTLNRIADSLERIASALTAGGPINVPHTPLSTPCNAFTTAQAFTGSASFINSDDQPYFQPL
jgi:hypothetical protein